MYAFTKIIGVVLFSCGLVLLMACFESIHISLEETLLLGFGALVFMAVGILCLLWHEPYTEDQE